MNQKNETTRPDRLFGVIMAWTVFTTVFVWLPIVRAVARPDGYQWGFFGLHGEGLNGPFLVFPLLALFAVLLLGHAWWRRRGLFRVLLLAWHFGWAGLLLSVAVTHGSAARWQGRGWRFDFPIPIIAVVFTLFALVVARWAWLDWMRGELPPSPRWTPTNTRRLIVAALLAPVAVLLFRYGSDFNWVTALAVGITVAQWVTFSEALASEEKVVEAEPLRH